MDANITIIGSGVIGLAISEELSNFFDNIFVIEKHKKSGQETSSRNSEVIHAGIYYPKGSLKARLCVEGKKLLYDLCQKEDIAHKKCGKLIVATREEEIPLLDAIMQKALSNGVDDVRYVERHELQEIEQNVQAERAILSPSTGIIDSHGLMKYLESQGRIRGVNFIYNSEVTGIKKLTEGYEITIRDADGQPYRFSSGYVINAAGLEAGNVAKLAGMNHHDYTIHFCKGEYFRVNPPKHKLVKHLVYPVPDPNITSLGIHSVIDLNGGLKIGPSAFYLDKPEYNYSVNPANQSLFYEAAKRYFPFIEADDLTPDMAGIRPKVQKPGESIKDFIIREETDNGFPGFINLIGMESPGLTSCLSIAKYVKNMI